MNIFQTDFIEVQGSSEDEDFESPYGSTWIVSIDIDGKTSILKAPNIHYSFFDMGNDAEAIGLPFETGLDPGVYEWKCNVRSERDDFTGEYWGPEFDVIEEKLLWSFDKLKEEIK